MDSTDHPFIVDMHDLFKSEKYLYMVMPLIKGADLEDFFNQK